MQPAVVQQLLELNRQFYQTFALQFSQTRQRLQPGVRKIVQKIPLRAQILDLGCGNSELARELWARGQQGSYTGLDVSHELLEQARQRLLATQAQPGAVGENLAVDLCPPLAVEFQQADLARLDWSIHLKEFLYNHSMGHTFDPILAFAVLHHLPGESLRLQLLDEIRGWLSPGGRFIHSNWQFLNSPRLARRCQPWSRLGLSDDLVDPGDYLLDWRQGGEGLRYVHHFSLEELDNLAGQSGFVVREYFYSDGAEGNLALYQVWQAA